jgi:DNA-binding transcriptional regulator YdaS (Cro superfamily)
MTPEIALEHAIQIVGSAAELARQIGVTRQAINGWDVCPADRVLAVAEAVRKALKRPRHKITKYDLRPDVYRRRAGAHRKSQPNRNLKPGED